MVHAVFLRRMFDTRVFICSTTHAMSFSVVLKLVIHARTVATSSICAPDIHAIWRSRSSATKSDGISPSRVKQITGKGVEFTQPVRELEWGKLTAFRLPDGEEMFIYEAKHPSPQG